MDKKGFTLIELLAVIVILAIIALIATPIVLNIISDAKEETGLRSADFYLDAVELSIAQATLDGENINDGNYDILESGNLCISYEDGKDKCASELELEVKGEIINKGTVTIKDGQIEAVILIQNNKIIEKDDKGELSYKKIKSPKSFEEDEWDTIIDNVKIGNIGVYEKNLIDNTNNTKKITLTGFGEKTVRIANTKTDGCDTKGFSQTACGFVVEFVSSISSRKMNSTLTTIGGWRDSEMREYINNDIFNSFPDNLRNNILTTYTVSGNEEENASNYKTYDKLYLLSIKEVLGNASVDTAEKETKQLDYYLKREVTTSNFEVVSKGFSWWLRSVRSSELIFIDEYGEWWPTDGQNPNGIAPAFRL